MTESPWEHLDDFTVSSDGDRHVSAIVRGVGFYFGWLVLPNPGFLPLEGVNYVIGTEVAMLERELQKRRSSS